jgi:ATPase subunit of ABC transporter with duplicated ATPase domains
MPHPSAAPAATVVAHRITKDRGAARILTDVDLTVGPEHRVGVVGPNGVGKSTLLQILAGVEAPDSGRVVVTPPGSTIAYLAQELEVHRTETLSQLLARRTGIADAAAELEAAGQALAAAGAAAGSGSEDRYSFALERYLALGAPDFEARTEGVLDDLGLPSRLLDLPTASLSGGQRARSSLAALLLARHDLLLLDEPTNDLDFDGLDRLEDFLSRRWGGLVVVSHDRTFLERIVTTVVDIDEASHRVRTYGGGLAGFVEAKATARRHAEEAYQGYVAERDRLRARERSQREWAARGVSKERRNPKDGDKAQRDFRLNRTEKQASKVRITERALARLGPVEKPWEPWDLHLDLALARRSGDVVARLSGAVVRRGEWQLGPLDLEVRWADRLAIVGPNGSGKTTLLAALLGRVALHSGALWTGPSVVVGALGQERRRFSEGESTLLGAFMAALGPKVPEPEARSLLAKFGLGAAHVLRAAASLSPGERTRAELALLVARGTNCLVLDEPTNHLDVPAIEQLEGALEAWEGTLLLVSHDRRLLETVRVTEWLELGQPGARRTPRIILSDEPVGVVAFLWWEHSAALSDRYRESGTSPHAPSRPCRHSDRDGGRTGNWRPPARRGGSGRSPFRPPTLAQPARCVGLSRAAGQPPCTVGPCLRRSRLPDGVAPRGVGRVRHRNSGRPGPGGRRRRRAGARRAHRAGHRQAPRRPAHALGRPVLPVRHGGGCGRPGDRLHLGRAAAGPIPRGAARLSGHCGYGRRRDRLAMALCDRRLRRRRRGNWIGAGGRRPPAPSPDPPRISQGPTRSPSSRARNHGR